MKCCVEDCERDARYKADKLCQKHYFRKWRYGHTGLNRSRKYRVYDSRGYTSVYEPDSPLADKTGSVWEHRFILYQEYGDNIPHCGCCGMVVTWKNCHVDHIDEDRGNNERSNLRVLCRGCNVARTGDRRKNRDVFRILSSGGQERTAAEWSRDPRVKVSYATIIRRKQKGWSDHDALFRERVTHKNTVVKRPEVGMNSPKMRKLREEKRAAGE